MNQWFIFGRAFWKSFRVCGIVLQYGCIAHCTLQFVGGFVICSGPSMMNTLKENDILLVQQVSFNFKKVKREDIVIARSPEDPNKHICKRVVAVEFDRIDHKSTNYSFVPKGHVWLEGDNFENSVDSRVYGPVPYGLIRCKAFYKIWPWHDIGTLQSD